MFEINMISWILRTLVHIIIFSYFGLTKYTYIHILIHNCYILNIANSDTLGFIDCPWPRNIAKNIIGLLSYHHIGLALIR